MSIDKLTKEEKEIWDMAWQCGLMDAMAELRHKEHIEALQIVVDYYNKIVKRWAEENNWIEHYRPMTIEGIRINPAAKYARNAVDDLIRRKNEASGSRTPD